jgi:hypothetical protein
MRVSGGVPGHRLSALCRVRQFDLARCQGLFLRTFVVSREKSHKFARFARGADGKHVFFARPEPDEKI